MKTFVPVALAAFLLPGAAASGSGTSARIVSVASASLRESASLSARQISRLTLGTLLTELARTGGVQTISGNTAPWLRVSTPSGEEGWVFGALTLPYSEKERDAIALEIAAERLKKEGESFESFVELHAFVARVAEVAGTKEARARLELARLRVLDGTAGAIGFRRLQEPLVLAWVEANRKDLVYSEPGGRWIVVAERYWELHEKSSKFPMAEEIAWVAARAYLPGECEGYLPCSIGNIAGTDGRYLELHPHGAHAGEALSNIAVFLDGVAEDPHQQYARKNIEKDDLSQVTKELTRMQKALAPLNDPRAGAALSSIEVLLKRYR